jgi:hypothetical protein
MQYSTAAQGTAKTGFQQTVPDAEYGPGSCLPQAIFWQEPPLGAPGQESLSSCDMGAKAQTSQRTSRPPAPHRSRNKHLFPTY